MLQYNATIAQLAAANGWAYVDPNVIVAAALASRTNGRADQLRKCQDLPAATSALALQAAVLNTCPVFGPTAAPNFFGLLSSVRWRSSVRAGPASHCQPPLRRHQREVRDCTRHVLTSAKNLRSPSLALLEARLRDEGPTVVD